MTKTLNSYKACNAWSNSINPLRGLTLTGIQQLVEQIKRGNDIRLQLAFKNMEGTMPIFGVCINKRTAGVINRQWDIVPIDESPEALAQAEVVKKMFTKSDTRNLDGLTHAIRHLVLAAFRGRSAVKPFISADGDLYFKNIENWNTLEWNDKLYWNPEARRDVTFVDANGLLVDNELQELTDSEVAWIKDDRPVDIPGLQIYLRQLVGEENWARAVEKYGVAQVVLTPPEGTPDELLGTWSQRAVALFEGGSGLIPPGSKIDVLTAARGQDPFSTFVEHLMEMVALLALGEKMTLLGGATGLGSDLASQQKSEFDSLVTYDCKRIANALTSSAVRKCVMAKFGQGTKLLCRFDFVESKEVDPEQYLALAKQCQDLGIKVDIAKLRELTGLQFISEEEKDVWSPKGEND